MRDPARDAWKVFWRVLVLLAVTLLLLLAVGQQVVRIVEQELRGFPPHVVLQTEIPTEKLTAVMRDMSRWTAERGLPRKELIEKLDSILISHRAPDQDEILQLRRTLIQEYDR